VSTMIFEVYDALKDAGATEEKAKKAAESLANYESRFNKVESELTLLKWMVGFNIGLSVAILLKLFG
jgi:DNA integrity scanning protein DisA with diadenylate cyclase activity